ncbi:MAG: hypothetical protein IPJ65_43835 [Archangiaceae bacterium]|nr:hypothetical protein [Archangiaceae bacterium]
MKRVLLASLVAAAAAGAWWLWRARAAPEPSSALVTGLAPVVPLEAPAPPAPLPATLTVTAPKATQVEVKRRSVSGRDDCASEGTDEPLCPGEYDVRATGDGTVALKVLRLEPGEKRELKLELEKALTLELTVLDDQKLPVDRASVVAQHTGTGFIVRGRSDSDGTVSLGPVTAGDWQVIAMREGWAPGAGSLAAGRSTTLRLANLGWVEGTLDPGTPEVKLELATLEHVTVASGVTQASGAFRLGPQPPGKYELVVRDEQFVPHAEAVSLPSSNVVVRASTGATLKGDLYGPARERLSGPVTVEGPGPTRTVTARDGAFEVRALTPGRWSLRSGEGRAVVVIDGGVQRVELTVPKYEGFISGTCEREGGHRLPEELVIRATSEDGARVLTKPCAAGRFELTGLPRGFYELQAEARERDERWSGHLGTASTGTRDVKVKVPGVAWLKWRLVDENGRGLEAERQREHFESRDLELPLALPGYVPVTRTASLERGRDTALGEVALKKGGRITGRVLDATSKDPVAGATVSVGGFEQRTGPDGTFRSDEAPDGEVELSLSHPRYVPLKHFVSMPVAGQVELELTRANRITGALLTADGSAPRGLEVWAMSGAAAVSARVIDGAFASGHLEPGRWLVRVMRAGEDAAPASGFDTLEVDLKPQEERVVSLIERVAGVSFEVLVTDRDGTPTLSDVLLVPRPQTAPADEQQFARLLHRPGLPGDPLGEGARYRFSSVPPGAYTLLANAHGRVWTVATPVVVQAGMGPLRLTFPQVPYSR